MNGIFVKYDLDNVMLSLSLHLCVNFSEKDFCDDFACGKSKGNFSSGNLRDY